MTSRYYQTGAQRAARVQTLFGRIARRYDLINDLQSLGLHRIWKRRLVREVAGCRTVLDVCCGTGDVALRLQSAGARVLGVDFSLPMLDGAERRRRQLPTQAQQDILFVAGDGLRLPLRDASVDAVTISYGLRNLADFSTALREFRRVAKPGGRLAILDFGKPDGRGWRAAYFAYLRFLVPVFGRLLAGDGEAYSYILESLRHYPGNAAMGSLLETCGWREVRHFPLLRGMMHLHTGTAQPTPPQPS